MSKGDIQQCKACRKLVRCDETDGEKEQLFKKDFPTHDFEDSEYVCWDCYNIAMKKRDSQSHGKVKV